MVKPHAIKGRPPKLPILRWSAAVPEAVIVNCGIGPPLRVMLLRGDQLILNFTLPVTGRRGVRRLEVG